jgi:hypothetical protein
VKLGIATGVSCPFRAVGQADGLALCRLHWPEPEPEPDPEPEPAASITEVGGVVYYMGCPDKQLVKIGTSSNLRRRWKSLRAVHPRLVLLATEPGRYAEETRRHHQFRSLLASTHSREWFRKAPVLMEHIAVIRSRHGIIYPSSHVVPAWAIAPLRPLVIYGE